MGNMDCLTLISTELKTLTKNSSSGLEFKLIPSDDQSETLGPISTHKICTIYSLNHILFEHHHEPLDHI